MQTAKNKATTAQVIKHWFSKSWVQWLIATLFFFLISWLYMGAAISSCSTSSTALGSDSTGGFGWVQWASGNDLTWDHTDKSNFPYGETLGKPQFITASLFIGVYKVLAMLTSPICGINLMLLLGYMSTGLIMFGFVRWLIKRFDIALFAGYAAAFVPFHQLKAMSHINYVYGSFFIAIIWAYIWLMQRPSYKRAALFGAVASLGFYFDGYYILISSLVVAGLCLAMFIYAAFDILRNRKSTKKALHRLLNRLKYLIVGIAVLGILLVPILAVYKTSGEKISQNLSLVRSDIKTETITYGARPIEFISPSVDSALLPQHISALTVQPHGSNASESTLYMGWTVIILALIALIYAVVGLRKKDNLKDGVTYNEMVLVLVCVFIVCFAFSLPALVTIFGHVFKTPTYLVTLYTANWRTVARLFLAMHPAVVLLAGLGLYKLTKDRSTLISVGVVALCGVVLFCEFLPSQLHPTQDLNKNAPQVYKMLQKDTKVKLVAEYPITSFLYTPTIFTFQPIHNKTLLNANDGTVSVGPIDGSIAGLNDVQTIGVLKALGVDMVITHGMKANNPNLIKYYALRTDGSKTNANSIYSYKIASDVSPRNVFLVAKTGYESLSVDVSQVSHRYITTKGTMGISRTPGSNATTKTNTVAFDLSSACPKTAASVTIKQNSKNLWSGVVGATPTQVTFNVNDKDFQIETADCSIDITNMSAQPAYAIPIESTTE